LLDPGFEDLREEAHGVVTLVVEVAPHKHPVSVGNVFPTRPRPRILCEEFRANGKVKRRRFKGKFMATEAVSYVILEFLRQLEMGA